MRSNNEELNKLLTNVSKANSCSYKDLWEILKTKIRDYAKSCDIVAWDLARKILDDMEELEGRVHEHIQYRARKGKL